MRERSLAKRYGKAFFDLTLQNKDAQKICQNIALLSQMDKSLPSFSRILSDERIRIDRRIKIAEEIGQLLDFSVLTSNLLKLLIAKQRIKLLPLIVQDFEARNATFDKISSCLATVAHETDKKGVQAQITKILSDKFKKQILCKMKINKRLIGGFTLNIADTFYDASLKGQLLKLKESLLT